MTQKLMAEPSSDIQSLLKKHGFSPSKRLGQNFLIDEKVLETIVSAADLKKDDLVLEIGPGPGNLTKKLAERAGRIIVIEKDLEIIPILKESTQGNENVEVVEGDIMKINLAKYIERQKIWKIVANIPYYLTSPIIRLFLENDPQPEKIVILIQKEVGERIMARKNDASFISVLVQFYGRPEIIGQVPRESFWPAPKVDSVIIKISDIKKPADFDPASIKKFFRLAKIGFASRRKTLANNLSAGLKMPREEIIELLKSSGLEPTTRAQELTVEQWKTLFQEVKKQSKTKISL